MKRKIIIALRWLVLALITFVPVYATTYYYTDGEVLNNTNALVFIIVGFLAGLMAAVNVTNIALDFKKALWRPTKVIGYVLGNSFAIPLSLWIGIIFIAQFIKALNCFFIC